MARKDPGLPSQGPAMTGDVFGALFVAHQVGDHWVQTQRQSDRKGLSGWPGRLACAAHVATYTATALVTLGALHQVKGLKSSPLRLAAGLTVSAVSHYIADRRTPLKRLADRTGAGRFYRLGAPRAGHDDNPTLGGAYALDQSFHYLFLFVAALIIDTRGERSLTCTNQKPK